MRLRLKFGLLSRNFNEVFKGRAASSLRPSVPGPEKPIPSIIGTPTSTTFRCPTLRKALGIALALPQIPVIVCDGDGSVLMGLGALTTITEANPKNLKIFVFDNECYSGPGRFPTATAGKADLEVIARGAGIKNAAAARELEDFRKLTKQAFTVDELSFVVAKVEKTEKLRPEIKPVPFDLMENTFLLRQALAKQGLIETWHDFFKGKDIY